MPRKDGTGPDGKGPKKVNPGVPARVGGGGGVKAPGSPTRVGGGGGNRTGRGRGRGGSPSGGGRGIKR